MLYNRISADCHVDLCWLPPDLFTSNASAAMKDRMPYVTAGPKGPVWVTKKGANFGLLNGMGSAGREYVPGVIHRSDRMASTGLYEDGKKGIRRLTDPERLAGLANIPSHSMESAVAEVKRVAKKGGFKGLDLANRPDMVPLWDPFY